MCSFYIKNKLKYPIFNEKNFFSAKCLFLSQQSNNWEISRKNLVAFKRWGEIKDEKFQYYEGSLENLIFRGVTKNQYIEGNCLKRGGLDTLQI